MEDKLFYMGQHERKCTNRSIITLYFKKERSDPFNSHSTHISSSHRHFINRFAQGITNSHIVLLVAISMQMQNSEHLSMW